MNSFPNNSSQLNPVDLALANSGASQSESAQRCKVCGDIFGCGINFGCLSCESCKAFFRRSCAKVQQPVQQGQQCPFSGQCRITKVSRRACPPCRWAKCVEAGMRKELVDAWKKHWGDREKTTAPAKTEENTKKSRKNSRKNLKSASGKLGTDGCVCKCTCGAKRADGQTQGQPVDAGTQTDLADSRVELICPSSSSSWQPNALTLEEGALLDELAAANSIMDAPLRLSQLLPFNLSLMDALRVSELAMRRMVEMVKRLASFRSLDQRDQVTLLRARLIELLILRGAMVFDPNNGTWRHAAVLSAGGEQPHSFLLNFNVLPAQGGHYEEHKRFLMTFEERWRTNRSVMFILHAIVLFSARDDLLVSQEMVQAQRDKYCSLLKSYLLVENANSGLAENEAAFNLLMGKLEELRQLTASFQRLYTQLNPSELEPLLQELFAAMANRGQEAVDATAGRM